MRLLYSNVPYLNILTAALIAMTPETVTIASPIIASCGCRVPKAFRIINVNGAVSGKYDRPVTTAEVDGVISSEKK